MEKTESLTITIALDGNQFCTLLGVNIMEGIAGWGQTVEESIDNFCHEWKIAPADEKANAIESLRFKDAN